MSNQEVETSSSKSDLLLVTLAALLAIAGVVGFALLSEEALAIRLGVLGGGLVLAVIIAWFSPSGKRFLNYGQQSWEELRRVVWPTRKETLNTTGLVMALSNSKVDSMADGKMNWYTLHVYSSMEKSVKNALEERIAQSGELRSSFGEVLLPTEKVHEVRNGRKVTSERRMYPGYVFIQMEMNDATWHLVNSTPRIIEFLGNNNPVPLSPTEVANILSAAENSSDKPRPKIEFEIGEMVRIKSGAFKDFTGRVDGVDYDKSRLNVFVSIFGRDTLVDLGFNEVEKI